MFKVWADGSVRGGNPGLGGIGIIVKHDNIPKYASVEFARIIGGNKTSNEVEYEALIAAIEYLKEINTGKEKCIITTDSRLVHGHVTQGWKCNFDHLRVLRERVWVLLEEVPFEVEIKWVSRWDNEIANGIAQAITAEEKERMNEIH